MKECEDAISRQDVLEKAGYTETEEGWCGYTVDVDYIKSLPSVYPKAKVGKWIRQQSYLGYTHSYECSECGRVVYKDEFEDMQIDYPYCHCGAKMESEE